MVPTYGAHPSGEIPDWMKQQMEFLSEQARRQTEVMGSLKTSVEVKVSEMKTIVEKHEVMITQHGTHISAIYAQHKNL